ncbi:ice-binding family protein [Nonomuraea sp. NPDC005501]|uniref:ice-binding family protein n=1 Tax=Nonomuraea sp. NPDC005501 TaxID=3156884 RepID=UPI0033A8A5FE
MTRIRLPSWLSGVLTAALLAGTLSAGISTRGEQPPVELGEATDCAIVAGMAVVATDRGLVVGDVYVSPGDTVRGFPPGRVRGSTHVDDGKARLAKADAAAAYQDTARRRPDAVMPTNLGGMTVPPGVYRAGEDAFQITGTLTLDAEGDPDAVFIFQSDSLNTARVSNIDLVDGAQANNVFWQVAGPASLGTESTFRGNILAQESIMVSPAAVVYGRTMALDDMVQMVGSTSVPDTRVMVPEYPPTTTTVTSSANPARKGQPITFTAKVTGPDPSVVPTGKVLFKDGESVIGSGFQSSTMTATFTTSGLAAGRHQITATYLDGGFAVNEDWVTYTPSVSDPLIQLVN